MAFPFLVILNFIPPFDKFMNIFYNMFGWMSNSIIESKTLAIMESPAKFVN
jgi:hypothetical protein